MTGERLPLSGVRVLEPTQNLAGPSVGLALAGLGAEVIKIEGPSRPDAMRNNHPVGEPTAPAYDRSAYFNEINRTKLGMTLDLKDPEGAALFRRLALISDVVIESNRAGVMDKLGLGYPTLSAANPRLIMLSMSAFGADGPYAGFGSFGPGIDAMSGIAALTGYEGGAPLKPDNTYTDEHAGLVGVFAILLALLHRRDTGRGQFIDLSMREALVPTFGEAIIDFDRSGRVTSRQGNRHPSMAPHNAYPCRGDDRWVAIAIGSDAEWRSLCAVMGNPPWADDPRFATVDGRWRHQAAIDERLAVWTPGFEHRELGARLQAAGVAAGAVLDAVELISDPHLAARGFFTKAEHPAAGELLYHSLPWQSSRPMQRPPEPAPRFGEHNAHVLRTLLGLSDEEIAALAARGVIAAAPPSRTARAED